MTVCKKCNKSNCHGGCDDIVLEIMEQLGDDMSEFDKFVMRVPKANYILDSKVASIFGTGFEIVNNDEGKPEYDSEGNVVDNEQTKTFEAMLYNTNENGNTNMSELKRAIREREIFGESYLFFDDANDNFYFLRKNQVTTHKYDDKDSIIKRVAFYTVGSPDMPEENIIRWNEQGYIRQVDENGNVLGYIIHPDNLIRFYSGTYMLNSDIEQLKLLVDIVDKFEETTTLRDFGDVYALTEIPRERLETAGTNDTIRTTAEKTLKKMNEMVASLMKKDKTEDSNAIVLDNRFKDIKQLEPVIKPTDYQFIWENQDQIVSSALRWPTILSNLGNESGNVSKSALIKEARANFLTPTKDDVANALSKVAKSMFGESSYIRFKPYEEIDL